MEQDGFPATNAISASSSNFAGPVNEFASAITIVKMDPDDECFEIKSEDGLENISGRNLVITRRTDSADQGSSNSSHTPVDTSIAAYCKSVIVKHRKPKMALRCSVCNQIVVHSFRPSIDAALSHILRHISTKNIFRCKYCDFCSSDRRALSPHLVQSHYLIATNSLDDHFNISEENWKEFCEMIDKCLVQTDKKRHRTVPKLKLSSACPPKSRPPSTTTVFATESSIDEWAAILSIANNSNRKTTAKGRECSGHSNKGVDQNRLSAFRLVKHFRTVIHPIWEAGGLELSCQECGMIVSTSKQAKDRIESRLFHHVLSHMDKSFHCCFCRFKSNSRSDVIFHLKTFHDLPLKASILCYFQHFISANSQKIISIAKACFRKKEPVLKEGSSSSIPRNLDGYSALCNYCSDLAKTYPHPQVICRQCGVCVTVNFEGRYAFEHASRHFGRALFACKYCRLCTVDRQNMRQHMSSYHGFASCNDFIDNSEKFREEFLTSLKQCYEYRQQVVRLDQPNKPLTLPVNVSEPEVEVVKPPSPVQVPPVSPHDYCLRLVNQFSSNGELLCLECKMRIPILTRNPTQITVQKAVDHALIHLGRSAYACQLCQYHSRTRETMGKHFLAYHPTEPAENFIDYSAQCRSEILSKLDKCYQSRQGDYGIYGDIAGDDSIEMPVLKKFATTTSILPRLDASVVKKSIKRHKKQRSVAKKRRSKEPSPVDHDAYYEAPDILNHSAAKVRKVQVGEDLEEKDMSPRLGSVAIVKYRNFLINPIKCQFCQMRTRHKKLLERHVKAMHNACL